MNKGIRKIFSEVPHTYELVNHILTFGMDSVLRRKAAGIVAENGGARWLDVCTGTGDMALNLRKLNRKASIIGIDFSYPMLKKAIKKSDKKNVAFILGDVSSMPFQDSSFGAVVISFATRNINYSSEHLQSSIHEFHRILKPGGVFVNLETSQPSLRIIKILFHTYVKLIFKRIGYYISGSKAGYAYLSHTIPRFYNPVELSGLIQKAGFENLTFQSKMCGTAAIHKAVKIGE